MKALIAITFLVLTVGMTTQARAADPLTSGLFLYSAFGGTMWIGGKDSDTKPDPRKHKDVRVHNVGAPGYEANITQFHYEQSPEKYVLLSK